MTRKTAWSVIVSSRSGGGKAARDWPKIAKLLKDRKIEYVGYITDHAGHAIEIARKAVTDGFRKILVVGGDGALHEALNGIYSQDEVSPSEVTIGLIPVGSGNDWGRLHKIPLSYKAAVSLVGKAEMHTRVQDVARVETVLDGKPFCRYMANIGGFGFDSEVCHRFNEAKAKGRAGDKQYLRFLISGFFSYKNLDFRIDVDGREFYRGQALSVALGIGKYCGGGMMQTPDAVPDDGLIDLTVTGNVSKRSFLTKLPSLFRGTIFKHKEVLHTRGRIIDVAASPDSYVEVDGEAVGFTPAHIEVVPAGIRVVSNL